MAVFVSTLAALVASAACFTSTAQADRIYWVNAGANKVSFANLDGSGGADLATTGTTLSNPFGVAIDLVAGRVYVANTQADKISFANLDGSGGGDLTTTGATVDGPAGITLDRAAGRIYWANNGPGKISFANLDGSGGGDLSTTGATVSGPSGVALDASAGRIYWANIAGDKISFANLDGSGGGDLSTIGATVDDAQGVALDVAAGRIYWTNYVPDKISFANLDGSGGGDLAIVGATVNGPLGVALDPPAGRIYWANADANKISSANVNGSGGADLPITGATADAPVFPVLLEAPRGAGAPAVTGGSLPGSVLSCSQGTWAADLIGSFLYRAPQGFAFQWSRGGADIAGATASSLAADTAGDYRCAVTATNAAGSSSQTSPAHAVSLPAFGARTLVALALAVKRLPAEGPLKVRVTNRNDFAIAGRLSGRTLKKVSTSKRRVVKLKAKRFTVGAQAKKTVKLRLPKALGRLLRSKGKLSLRLTAKVTDPAGNTRAVKKRVAPKLKAKKRKR